MSEPIFRTPGVGVAGIAIEGERVLLIRRANPPAAGRWAFPGGRLEPAESLAEAVRREIEEECGLRASVGPLVDVVEVVEAPWHWIVLQYLVQTRSGALRAAADALEARWFDLDDLDGLEAAPRTAELARRARRMFDSTGAQYFR